MKILFSFFLLLSLTSCGLFSPYEVVFSVPVDVIELEKGTSVVIDIGLFASGFSYDANGMSTECAASTDDICFEMFLAIASEDLDLYKGTYTEIISTTDPSWKCTSDLRWFCTYEGQERTIETSFQYELSITDKYPALSSKIGIDVTMHKPGLGANFRHAYDSVILNILESSE